jgi:hypothetical protein
MTRCSTAPTRKSVANANVDFKVSGPAPSPTTLKLATKMDAVMDTTLRGWDLNRGVGDGSVAASDRWVLKAIVGVPF